MLVKLGQTFYNGKARPIYILQGNAVRDAEDAPVNGKDHAKVAVAAAQNEQGGTVFVTVNGWRQRAAEVARIQKMDSVLAVGILKKREYNGNNYYDLDADFVAISGAGLNGVPAMPSYTSASLPPQEYTELPDDDGELPF